jgi:hypothetical protein
VITPDILHDHIETDLDDYALERYIDDAYAAIHERRGDRSGVQYRTDGGGLYLFLDPPSDAITSVTEDGTLLVDGEEDDYTVRWDGRALRRVGGGEWGDTIVVYDASDDDPRTDRVVIDLCKLALQYEGLQSSGDGDYDESHLEYQAERNRLISELTSSVIGFA